MKTFKEYLVEATNIRQKELNDFKQSEARHDHTINGWNVKTSVHAGARAFQRRPDFKKDDWKDIHIKVIQHIQKELIPDGEHIFYSGKKRQGYVAKVDNRNKKLTIITTLDPGVTRATAPNTSKHIIESTYIVYILD